MRFDEIMKLLDAGYTKDEIMAMNDEAGEDPKVEPTEPENTEPATDDNAVDMSAITDALGEVKATFDELKKEMIAMNIMNSRIENPEQSADDILANIINPFENK